MNRSLVFCVLLLSATSLAVAQDEQWLAYRYDGQIESIISDTSSQSIQLAARKPSGVDLPEFKDSAPLFGKWNTPMTPKGNLWVAFDRTTRRGPYDLLYIDSNADGSLKDETAITAYEKQQYGTEFGPVPIVFPSEDGPVTYHLNLRFYGYEDNQPMAYATSACWYEGEITVGGNKRQCMLVDYNANGAFDDKSLNQQSSDRVRLKMDKEKWDAPFVGNLIPIDEKIYRLEVARDGAYIKLAEATDLKFGSFRIPTGIAKITFGGENGRFVFRTGDGTGQLPVGKYRIVDWAIEQKDDKGKNWRIRAGGSNDKVILDIAESAEQKLTVGWPIKSSLDVQRSGKAYRLNHTFIGQLDERFNITCDGKQPPAPKVRITNADKTYDKSFSLEYG